MPGQCCPASSLLLLWRNGGLGCLRDKTTRLGCSCDASDVVFSPRIFVLIALLLQLPFAKALLAWWSWSVPSSTSTCWDRRLPAQGGREAIFRRWEPGSMMFCRPWLRIRSALTVEGNGGYLDLCAKKLNLGFRWRLPLVFVTTTRQISQNELWEWCYNVVWTKTPQGGRWLAAHLVNHGNIHVVAISYYDIQLLPNHFFGLVCLLIVPHPVLFNSHWTQELYIYIYICIHTYRYSFCMFARCFSKGYPYMPEFYRFRVSAG